jgi:hypothetical protein
MPRLSGTVALSLALLAGAVALLAWNEGRAVRTARALAEGARRVVEVDADRAAQAADGALIHLVTEATVAKALRDPLTGVARDALRLRRSTETLQWRRISVGDDNDSRYDYRLEWSASPIDSDAYPDAHRNPAPLPLPSATLSSPDARLAAFALATTVVDALTTFEPIALSPAELQAMETELGLAGIVRDDAPGGSGSAEDGPSAFLPYGGGTPDEPQVGDVRLRYAAVPQGTVSVVARKTGARLDPFPTGAGVALAFARPGVHGAGTLFAEAVAQNRFLTGALRGFGFVLLALAFRLLLGPLAALASLVPLLGGVARFGVLLAAIVLAGATALTTVALAWVAFRPLAALGLLALAVALVVAFVRRPRAPSPTAASPSNP